MQPIYEGHDTAEAAHAQMTALKKRNPNATYSVIKGAKSGKHHVVHHTSGGMRMVEEVSIDSFEDFLTESEFSKEYHPVFKKHYFKKYPGGVHKHPSKGIVKINQHGHWEHTYPTGGKFEGSTGHSLDNHLSRLQESNETVG